MCQILSDRVNLTLAKEAFLKRGFSYVRQEDGLHYWSRQGDEIGNAEVSLWESEGGVWYAPLRLRLGCLWRQR